MTKLALPIASGFVVLALSSAAYAVSSLIPAMGHGIALQLCTTCHLIEPGQVNPPDHVGGPSFQTVANGGELTAEKLRKHLSKSNRRTTALTMPNVDLTRDEQNKLMAYIMSLRPAPPAAPPPAK